MRITIVSNGKRILNLNFNRFSLSIFFSIFVTPSLPLPPTSLWTHRWILAWISCGSELRLAEQALDMHVWVGTKTPWTRLSWFIKCPPPRQKKVDGELFLRMDSRGNERVNAICGKMSDSKVLHYVQNVNIYDLLMCAYIFIHIHPHTRVCVCV